jgi:hypothetical protein
MNIRLSREKMLADPVLAPVYQLVQQTIIDKLPSPKKMDLIAARRTLPNDGYVPIWKCFTADILQYIEENRQTLLPDIAAMPEILRPGVSQVTKRGVPLSVDMQPDRPLEDGYGGIGVRNLQDYLNQEYTSQNMQAKGKYSNIPTDNTGRSWIAAGVRPQLWLNPANHKWRLEVVVLRLRFAVRGANSQRGEGEIMAAHDDLYFQYHSGGAGNPGTQQEEILRRKQVRADKTEARRAARQKVS